MRAAWARLALLGLSACAQSVTGDGETLEGLGGEGGEWAPTPLDSAPASGSTSSGGGESGSGAESSSGDAGTGGCGADEHFCGGLCAGNTPATGCVQSASCEPCTAPEHGTAICTDEGTCDFTCADDYSVVDGQCACAVECCSSEDCTGGLVCSGGTCQPPPCYALECLGGCFLKLQCGGICILDTCTCFPCQ